MGFVLIMARQWVPDTVDNPESALFLCRTRISKLTFMSHLDMPSLGGGDIFRKALYFQSRMQLRHDALPTPHFTLMSTNSSLTFKVVWADLHSNFRKTKEASFPWHLSLPTTSHHSAPKGLRCLRDFQYRDALTCRRDVVILCVIPCSLLGLWESPSQLVVRHLRQNLQMGTYLAACPFSYILGLFSLCPSFLETSQLSGYSCSTWPGLSYTAGWALVSAHPLTSCSTCPVLLRFWLGVCFLMCGLVHPSEIKLGPSALLGLTSDFPSWPRFRCDLGLCNLWVHWLNT